MITRMMPFWLLCVLTASCSLNFAGPLKGPLLLDAQIRPNIANEVIVAISNARLKRHLRSSFLHTSDELYKNLNEVEGYVGGSMRLEPFGDQVWTLTIWTEKEAMDSFFRETHMATAFAQNDAIVKFRSTHFSMNSAKIPDTWEQAMEKIEKIPEKTISETS
ncbi:MAG: hypothetical protein HRU09_21100 [Oligoflexales bacterium]|nr:hypothetical protein [Oligoflexales bacterium]